MFANTLKFIVPNHAWDSFFFRKKCLNYQVRVYIRMHENLKLH
jgi:hypothetical protein